MSWPFRGPLPEPAFGDEFPLLDVPDGPAPTFHEWIATALPGVLAYGADFEAQPDCDLKRRGWTIGQAALAKEIPEPPLTQFHWGSLALVARKEGLLVVVGFAHAARRTTNKSVVHAWRVAWAFRIGGAK